MDVYNEKQRMPVGGLGLRQRFKFDPDTEAVYVITYNNGGKGSSDLSVHYKPEARGDEGRMSRSQIVYYPVNDEQ